VANLPLVSTTPAVNFATVPLVLLILVATTPVKIMGTILDCLRYSDFHNLMEFTSKKMPNNIL
jgi:hypothetical protein